VIVFLVGTNSNFKGIISYFALSHALDDYLEEYHDLIFLRDNIELDRIRLNPEYLTKSYLFSEIESFLLPYYDRRL